jgi:hypothetical protein
VKEQRRKRKLKLKLNFTVNDKIYKNAKDKGRGGA